MNEYKLNPLDQLILRKILFLFNIETLIFGITNPYLKFGLDICKK